MKLLLLTTNKGTLQWKSLPGYLASIKNALNSGKNADWTVEIQYIAAIPKVVDKRIDHTWLLSLFAPFYTKGYDTVGLHLSRKEWVAYGLESSLRGANPRTDDQLGDFYFWADEDSERRGLPQFPQTCLHEMAHEYYVDVKFPDQTHAYHDANPNIAPLFATFDWSLFQGKRQLLKKKVSLLQQILALLQKPKPVATLLHPVATHKHLITQAYGTPNTAYPATKHHIGTDYATPAGTRVLAPCNGKITVSGYSKTLGNYCVFTYTYEGVQYAARFLHLQAVPEQGTYARGETIGRTGNTGFSTGYHLHVDVWFNEVRLDLVNQDNFRSYTVDPAKHYV